MDLRPYVERLRIRNTEGKHQIFDPIRKQWFIITPEEMVRQAVIDYLISDKGYSDRLMNVEKTIYFNSMKRRFDLVVYDTSGRPHILVECKAPDFTLNDKVFRQASVYNQELSVHYLWLTNGFHHFIFQIDREDRSVRRLGDIPKYTSYS